MTDFEKLAPYSVLLVDDADLSTDFGPMTKILLETIGCQATHVRSIDTAIEEINRNYYDVLVIDINLGSGMETDGFKLQKTIRESGKVQPIIMATGQQEELLRPIKDYVDVFASGATFFYEKTRANFQEVFIEAVKHIDPIRRALYLLKKQGFEDDPLFFGGEEFRIDDLLIDSKKNENLIRLLRDAFYELFIEMWKNSDL